MSTLVSGHKCVYINCDKTRRNVSGLKMFRFPVDRELCKEWIINCGNTELASSSPITLRKKYVCQFHFEPGSITKSGRLVKNTVPMMDANTTTAQPPKIKYNASFYSEQSPKVQSLDVESPSTTSAYSIVEDVTNIGVDPESPSTSSVQLVDEDLIAEFLCLRPPKRKSILGRESAKKIEKLTLQLKKQSKLLKIKNAQISRLRSNNAKYKIVRSHTMNFASPQARTLALMQSRRLRTAWTKQEKDLAISLFHSSPSAYKNMRRLKIVLPGPSTVKKWIGNFPCVPDFNSYLFKQIKVEASGVVNAES